MVHVFHLIESHRNFFYIVSVSQDRNENVTDICRFLLIVVAVQSLNKLPFIQQQLILRRTVANSGVACSIFLSQIVSPSSVSAGMLIFPLPYPLKNNIVLLRAGESYADARHEIQTNPVKKLRQDNALTPTGREQIIQASKKLEEMGFQPSYIWVSNTERAYESAVILGK